MSPRLSGGFLFDEWQNRPRWMIGFGLDRFDRASTCIRDLRVSKLASVVHRAKRWPTDWFTVSPRRLIPQLPGLPDIGDRARFGRRKNKAGTFFPSEGPPCQISRLPSSTSNAAFPTKPPARLGCSRPAGRRVFAVRPVPTKGWPHGGKRFTYECAACGKQTSVTAGTIMHGSKLSLTVWFWAAYLMATHSNGISALQLQRQLAFGSYKSAWLLCAKLRRAMALPPMPRTLSGVAEVDETELPLRGKDDPVTGGGGRSGQGEDARRRRGRSRRGGPGRIRLAKDPDFSAKSLHGFVAANMSPGATIKTDGWSAYPGAPGVDHDPHVVGKMAAHVVLPWVHRVFANVKTWALGVYHGLREKHLQTYLDEFVFRFNRRLPVTPPSVRSSQSALPRNPSHTIC